MFKIKKLGYSTDVTVGGTGGIKQLWRRNDGGTHDYLLFVIIGPIQYSDMLFTRRALKIRYLH